MKTGIFVEDEQGTLVLVRAKEGKVILSYANGNNAGESESCIEVPDALFDKLARGYAGVP